MDLTIRFVRSGGLVAAPGLRVEGEVSIGPAGGRVSAEPAYHRRLDVKEQETLSADARAILSATSIRVPQADLPPDAFRFSLTIEFAERFVRIESAAHLEAANDALGRLIAWAAHESESIVQQRFRSPPRR